MVESTKKTTKTTRTTSVKKTTTSAKPTPGASSTVKPTPGAATTAKPASGTGVGGLNEGECPVCLEFCAKPVVAPCKHTVCFDCSKRLTEMGMTCPLCRAHFDKLFIPVVDRELQL